VLNPFKGHPAEKRTILDEANHETLAEFAWLDGAILFNKEGVASDAGRYIQVPAGVTTKAGEGGRHLAARAISQLTDGVAICVSSTGSITLYAGGRDRYKVRLS
jgi:DNA integrity scanning protein DisA with diadenylate cyclase activity